MFYWDTLCFQGMISVRLVGGVAERVKGTLIEISGLNPHLGHVLTSSDTMTLIEWPGFNQHPGHDLAFADKTLYDDYLCLVASNKQQIQWKRSWRNPQKLWKLLSRCGLLQSRSSHCNEKCASEGAFTLEAKQRLATFASSHVRHLAQNRSTTHQQLSPSEVKQPFLKFLTGWNLSQVVNAVKFSLLCVASHPV